MIVIKCLAVFHSDTVIHKLIQWGMGYRLAFIKNKIFFHHHDGKKTLLNKDITEFGKKGLVNGPDVITFWAWDNKNVKYPSQQETYKYREIGTNV